MALCSLHGEPTTACVCQHLWAGSGRGWVAAGGDELGRPDAWCLRCSAAWRDIGGWTDALGRMAGMRELCAECYDALRRRQIGRSSTAHAGRPFAPDTGRLAAGSQGSSKRYGVSAGHMALLSAAPIQPASLDGQRLSLGEAPPSGAVVTNS